VRRVRASEEGKPEKKGRKLEGNGGMKSDPPNTKGHDCRLPVY
jgi:hypothetical protein